MNIIKLEELPAINHGIKSGKRCEYIEPTIKGDTIFYENGEVIGFYLTKLPQKAQKLADLANAEFLSERVPKSEMVRSDVMKKQHDLGLVGTYIPNAIRNTMGTTQYSTIIGSIPPKPHMRRYAPNHSSVHDCESAETFVKAMWKLSLVVEEIIREIAPNIWERQTELLKGVPEEWRFGNLFTSSISNFNISAPFHIDTGNIKGAVNVIITKRKNAKGGCLNVPDYGFTFEQANNSILVYPAWKNIHGVTPIIPVYDGGYRNSLIFYPLAAFLEENLKKSN